ncbi:type III polyketide synthase [Leucobacter ruminantium]|uniref:Type III polyketide synthase n=2 Tax=Leucobacter ruminantium TaxID=1289170 RepID=A0A939LX75_9MICO|nr:type III polyketide synthase [Leucobacter ruminantium]MBO1806434.1 type III polyketide synthase [Leucobacter ruminantium]
MSATLGGCSGPGNGLDSRGARVQPRAEGHRAAIGIAPHDRKGVAGASRGEDAGGRSEGARRGRGRRTRRPGREDHMASIRSIGTAVPAARLRQSEVRDFFASQPGVDRLTARLIAAAFDGSAIETRYSAIGALGPGGGLFTDEAGLLRSPSTGERNDRYRSEAPALSASAARAALARSGFSPGDITHVITASCTGCFAPGPDVLLVKQLGIPGTAERLHVGFMGCAAAFPALRTAAGLCVAQPGSVALVVCTELCSLHIRSSRDPEQIVASAVFGDGAAAAIVASGDAPDPRAGGTGAHRFRSLEVDGFTTALTADGEADMDWTIGDRGFEMRLTAEVPRIVGREIAGVVDGMLDGADPAGIAAWAVHPGGRSVLDRVQQALALPDAAMAQSRGVLRDYGNMSSATILFILERMLREGSLAAGEQVAGLCFGPGLTVETVLLRCAGEGSADPSPDSETAPVAEDRA